MVALPYAAWSVSGCNRPNPLYGMEGSTDTGAATNGATVGSSGSSGGTSDSHGDQGNTSGGPSTADGSTAGPTDSATGQNTGDVELCARPPFEPLPFEIMDGDEVIEPPDDCKDILWRPIGSMTVADDVLYHGDCAACSCEPLEGLAVHFGGPVELPTLPGCGGVLAWPGFDAEGDCRWDGIAIFLDDETTIPLFFLLNSRQFPVDEFGNVPVGLVGDEDCPNPDLCDVAPGSYALSFSDGSIVDAGMTSEVAIDFYASVNFRVRNHMSLVDHECGEYVAWTGLQM